MCLYGLIIIFDNILLWIDQLACNVKMEEDWFKHQFVISNHPHNEFYDEMLLFTILSGGRPHCGSKYIGIKGFTFEVLTFFIHPIGNKF